jgi:phosphopantetheine adenylyltransferase
LRPFGIPSLPPPPSGNNPADELLAKKAHHDLLQSLEARTTAAADFMSSVRPALTVTTGALRDPSAPTQAELDPNMQALVVSRETLSGGEAINSGRRARGFEELRLVVVSLVGEQPGGGKLSSTALREQDAAAGRDGG